MRQVLLIQGEIEHHAYRKQVEHVLGSITCMTFNTVMQFLEQISSCSYDVFLIDATSVHELIPLVSCIRIRQIDANIIVVGTVF